MTKPSPNSVVSKSFHKYQTVLSGDGRGVAVCIFFCSKRWQCYPTHQASMQISECSKYSFHFRQRVTCGRKYGLFGIKWLREAFDVKSRSSGLSHPNECVWSAEYLNMLYRWDIVLQITLDVFGALITISLSKYQNVLSCIRSQSC